MPKVTVIIPVYGVEKYIERCARSLFEQTLDDIEYIFIDDCTPDGSMDVLCRVLEEYPARCGQVKFLRTPCNSGQHIARQLGIDAATGDYITHCDPDDEYSCPDALAKAHETALSSQADIVWWDFEQIFPGGKTGIVKQDCAPDKLSLIEKHLCNANFMGSLWNRIVSADIVKKSSIRHPEARIIEDLVYVIQYTMSADKFVYLPEALYRYHREHESSISYSDSPEKQAYNLNCVRKNGALIIDLINGNKAVSEKLQRAIFRFKWFTKNKAIFKVRLEKSCTPWLEIYPEIHGLILRGKWLSFREWLLGLRMLTHTFGLLK